MKERTTSDNGKRKTTRISKENKKWYIKLMVPRLTEVKCSIILATDGMLKIFEGVNFFTTLGIIFQAALVSWHRRVFCWKWISNVISTETGVRAEFDG